MAPTIYLQGEHSLLYYHAEFSLQKRFSRLVVFKFIKRKISAVGLFCFDRLALRSAMRDPSQILVTQLTPPGFLQRFTLSQRHLTAERETLLCSKTFVNIFTGFFRIPDEFFRIFFNLNLGNFM